MFPAEVHIHQTQNAGAVKRIEAKQPDLQWYKLWETNSIENIQTNRSIIFRAEFNVSSIDLYVYPHVLFVEIFIIQDIYVAIKSFYVQPLLDDGASRAGDLKSGSVLSRGSIISKRLHVFECIHVTCSQYSYDKVI